ncbi:hypothetical protein DXT76_16925 [Halobacillus trueperi]|uniref:Uncharacterized protein n=1 Tax=Halobacillus trueperi TaxID=156205 RepID=A0A3D8VIH8_9BACI|nr:hypothetical protein [Halobacillus trueperi]RDY69135.1 hypothetical protein DXT76_16925 [Halobacillus trueperi]
MSEVKCLVCRGKYFRRGYYEVETNVDIYSEVYHNIKKDLSYQDETINGDIDIYTDIHYDTVANSKLDLRLHHQDKKSSGYNELCNLYKYICEGCGYVMNFAVEKNVESKKEERNRLIHEKSLDWRGFDK